MSSFSFAVAVISSSDVSASRLKSTVLDLAVAMDAELRREIDGRNFFATYDTRFDSRLKI